MLAPSPILPDCNPQADQPISGRSFLFLQGPHGPFFDRLGSLLREAGAKVWRVGFNAGDSFFWSDRAHYLPFTGTVAEWPDRLSRLVREKNITDIVLYGDVRPVHHAARTLAAWRGLRLHVFEEGYLRPYWISYERGGANGHSALMRIPLAEMGAAADGRREDVPRPPALWGDMRQHKFYGALYHFLILAANRPYRSFRGHRDIGVFDEFRLHLRRLLRAPLDAVQRRLAVRRIGRAGWPFALVLLQLDHDSNFRAHSPFERQSDFTDLCLAEFAAHAPSCLLYTSPSPRD